MSSIHSRHFNTSKSNVLGTYCSLGLVSILKTVHPAWQNASEAPPRPENKSRNTGFLLVSIIKRCIESLYKPCRRHTKPRFSLFILI
ncbi:MAG: hypothetical protein [Circular genetic element sp.]|nr:MAG: hypothetical protein [Circular genetic element sp.]